MGYSEISVSADRSHQVPQAGNTHCSQRSLILTQKDVYMMFLCPHFYANASVLIFSFFGCTTQFMGSQFPDQGLNPGP